MKRLLKTALIAIFVLSVAALFLAHEDPFAREAVCGHTGFCPPGMPNAKALNKIFYDLAVGSLITLLFYLLVVRLPDYQCRQRLKRGLERHYKGFRELDGLIANIRPEPVREPLPPPPKQYAPPRATAKQRRRAGRRASHGGRPERRP